MPIVKLAVRKKKGGTTTAGQGTFFVREIGLVNMSAAIEHPLPGYVGLMDIILCGTSSGPGAFWSPDNKGGTQGSGQVVCFQYLARGDEVSFSLNQASYMSGNSGTLSLQINGGVNDGKYFVVGSAHSGNSYGAASAAPDRTSFSTAPYQGISFNGACRPYNSTINYSDNTSYPVATPSSYGSATLTKTYSNGSRRVIMRGSTSPGGLVLQDGAGTQIAEYGKAGCVSPSPWSNVVWRGACILAFPD